MSPEGGDIMAHGFLKPLQSINLCRQEWYDTSLARIIGHVCVMCGKCSYSSEGQHLLVEACKQSKLAGQALIRINITAWSNADIVC